MYKEKYALHFLNVPSFRSYTITLFSNISKFGVVNVKRFIRVRAGVSVVVFPK